MRWVPDKTGRFAQRPHYSPEELDAECEKIISAFLRKKYGRVVFPITTDDLTVLIEEKADLDSFADLSGEGSDVEGVTEFRPGKRPMVKISSALGDLAHKENRLRTTLTHEYGHVHFHQFMFDTAMQSMSLFPSPAAAKPQTNKCNRDSIVNAAETNWMEWQAGYACGALLMPVTALHEAVRQFCDEQNIPCRNIGATSGGGLSLIETISAHFQTSKDAARVRLLKKGILIDGAGANMGNLLRP
jgi:hypothetical protein